MQLQIMMVVCLKDLTNFKSIFGVLLRGRRGKVVICADIRKFYHQVLIKEDTQYCQLVFWCHIQIHRSCHINIIRTVNARL